MHFSASLLALLAATAPALAAVRPRSDYTHNGQKIPKTAKADGTFANGKPFMPGEPPKTGDLPNAMYNARDIDLPFGRLYHGNLNFYKGATNNPKSSKSTWGSEFDSADQSACGIPANAYWISQVAIHPYFLRYGGLERFCQQDVCISFWREDGKADMMLKVTDICTDDSADGIPCMTPQDIKIDRMKAGIIMSAGTGHDPIAPQGDQYKDKVWWFFTKCWDDGLVQPAYRDNNNWFADPTIPNNLDWSQQQALAQYHNNQKSYPAKGWATYPNGLYNTTRVPGGVDGWVKGKEPAWEPLAGGASACRAGAYPGKKAGGDYSKPAASSAAAPQKSSSSEKVKSTGYDAPKHSTAAPEKAKSTGYDAPKHSSSHKPSSSTAAPAKPAGSDSSKPSSFVQPNDKFVPPSSSHVAPAKQQPHSSPLASSPLASPTHKASSPEHSSSGQPPKPKPSGDVSPATSSSSCKKHRKHSKTKSGASATAAATGKPKGAAPSQTRPASSPAAASGPAPSVSPADAMNAACGVVTQTVYVTAS